MKLWEKLESFLDSQNVLYYPGCLTKFVFPELADNYRKILRKSKIDFIELSKKELCCGSPLKNAGAANEFRQIAQKNFQILKEHAVGKIVTNCPACAFVFRKHYPLALGEDWKIKTVHILELVEKISQPKVFKNKTAVYHDSCHLGRGLGIFNLPRKIITQSGLELLEMELTKENSFCCGGGGGVRSNNQTLSLRIGVDRISQAQKTKADFLITACPMCYAQLKKAAGTADKGKKIKVMEISQLLVN